LTPSRTPLAPATTGQAAEFRSIAADGAAGGDWPRTTRVLPWLIAAFLVMLWLIPVDSTSLPFNLPFDSKVDRFALGALAVMWLYSFGSGRFGPSWRQSRVNTAIFLFVLVSVASLAANATALIRVEEFELGLKKLSLLLCYATFFVIVATSVRKREIPRFLLLVMGLASITALGTVIEYRGGTNYFFEWTQHLPVVNVAPPPEDPAYGRASIVGPTQHGLADAAILAMVLPFAVVFMLQARDRRRQLLYAAMVALLFAGGIATQRKTALVLPITAFVVLFVYRPRYVVRLLPLGIAMFLVTHTVAPGALGGVRYQLQGGGEKSNEARTSDYAAVLPDIETRPWLGRGYGTYDPVFYEVQKLPGGRHRYLDNMLLHLVIEVGIMGLIAYLAIGGAAVGLLHRLARSTDRIRAGPALGVVAAVAVCVVASVLFDALAFRQVPYVYFFLLALGVVMAVPERRTARS
jgi:O-antigen ligase